MQHRFANRLPLPHRPEQHSRMANFLGWAGMGLGLAQLVAPHAVAGLLGLDPSRRNRGVLRVLGVREILQGVGLVDQTQPTQQLEAGIWGRVAGDLLDAALLGVAATKTRRPVAFAMVATAVAAIATLDAIAAVGVSRQRSE